MKNRPYKLIISVIVISLLIIRCEKNDSYSNGYVTLEYTDFMRLPHPEIADSFCRVINQNVTEYHGEVSIGLLFHDNLKKYVEKGYEYITENNARLTIWVDANYGPYFVTYVLTRTGDASNWSLDKETLRNSMMLILQQLGITQINPNEVIVEKGQRSVNSGYFYYFYYRQTYNGNPVNEPYIYSEIEGDSNAINLLSITRFYTNLNEILDTLSRSELKLKAIEYYQTKENVISVPEIDNLIEEGYFIVENKLCLKIGGAIIDEWGSRLDLFIDIQNGDIIGETELSIDIG